MRYFRHVILFILILNVNIIYADSKQLVFTEEKNFSQSSGSVHIQSNITCSSISSGYPINLQGNTLPLPSCPETNSIYVYKYSSSSQIETLLSCSTRNSVNPDYVIHDFTIHKKASLFCNYDCQYIKTHQQCKDELEDEDAYFDASSCSCKIPCKAPEDKSLIKFFNSLNECEIDKQNFETAYEDLQCHGCIDSYGEWVGGLYGNHIPCPNDNFYFDTESQQCICPTHVTRTCESGMYWDNDECMCLLNQTCEELAQDAAASCNQEVNDLFFECTTDISGYEVLVTRNDCVPKIPTCEDLRKQALASCPEEYNDFYFECTLDAFSHEPLVVRNECIPNGENPDYPSDCNATQTYNYDTQKCENNPENPNPENPDNNSTTPPDNNSTTPPDNNSNPDDEGTTTPDNNSTTPSDNNSTTPSDNNSTTPSDNNSNDEDDSTILPEHEDLSALEIEKLIEENQNTFDGIMDEFSTFKDNLYNQFSEIETQFNNTKALFSNEHSFSMPSGSTSGCIRFNFHGKNIEIDICEGLRVFQPFVYFVFTIYFMVLAVRFLVANLLRSIG
jgi:hypothetical protein